MKLNIRTFSKILKVRRHMTMMAKILTTHFIKFKSITISRLSQACSSLIANLASSVVVSTKTTVISNFQILKSN